MKSDNKAKEQPVDELALLKQRVADLEATLAESKKIKDAIQDSEGKYRTLVESATDSIFVADKDIKVLSVNTTGARFLRKNQEEIIGKSVSSLFPKEISKQFSENLKEIFRTGAPQQDESCFIINGNNLCLNTYLSPIKNSANEVVAVLGVARDTTERSRIEEELRESQRRYSALVEQSSDSILLIQDGLIKYANPATTNMVGFSPAEVIGKPFLNFIDPEQREFVADRNRRRMAGEDVPTTYETAIIRKDGKTIPVETSAVKIEYDGKSAVVAIRRDISARKKAEAEYRGIIEATMDGFWLADMQGRFLEVNDAYCKLTGYSHKELLKMSIPNIEATEQDEETATRIARIRKTGEDRFESRHRCKDGRIIDVEVSVNYIEVGDGRMIVFIRDITERKQAEKALQESEGRYRALVELGSEIGEAIVILQDTEKGEGIQTFASDAWLRTTGYSQKELLGKSFFDLINSEDRESSRERHRAKMSGEALSGLFEMSITRKDGTQVPIELTSTRTIYLGQPANVVYIRDITRRKKREEELRQTTARLATSQRVAKLGSWERALSDGNAFWSAEMFRLTGFEPSAPTPSFEAFLSFVHPEDRRLMQKHQANVIKTGKSGIFEFRTNPARGPVRNIVGNTEPLRDSEGKIIRLAGTLQDVTEVKTVEEKLKTAEQNFRNSLDDSPLGVRIATLNGELIYANNALFDITGYGSTKELKDVPLSKLYTPESYERYLARRAKRILGEPLPVYYEEDIVRKDGEIRHLLLSAKEVIWDGKKRVQVAYQDITEQKRLDIELRASEAKYRFLSDNMTDVAFITDLNIRTTYVTPSVEKVLGFTPEERIKQLPQEQLTPESLRQVSSLLYSELKKEKETGIPNTGPYVLELECYHKNGSVRVLESVLRPVRDETGKPTGIYGVGRDITERKRAERELRASEERFRNLVENAPIGIVIVDSEGRLIEANEAILKMHGYDSKAEYMKSTVAERYYDPRDRERWFTLVKKMGRITGFEVRNKRKDGSLFWASISCLLQTGKSGETQYLTVIQDITQQKQAEEEIRASEERYRNLVENAPTGMVIVDSKGRIIEANEAMWRMHGYDSEEEYIKAPSADRFYDPKDRERWLTLMREREKINGYEIRNKRKDGSLFWSSASCIRQTGKSGEIQYIVVAQDITQQKQALEGLRESEERYRALIRLGSEVGEAVVMLWETEGEESVHAFASEAWSKITGYSQDELLNMSFRHLVHPEDQPAARDRYYKRLSGEVTSEPFEETIVRKDGTEVMVEVTGARTNYKGKPAHVLYIRDITQRKKMEEQLMTQDRLASIGQLVSGVAHELNNPLTGVIGFSDLLLQQELPDAIKDDINVVNWEAKRAAAIVRNLLTFARKHPEEKRLVDINDGIKQVLELRAYEQKLNNIKVDTCLAPELPKILGNSTQLQQVFINIIANAEFFMTEAHQKGTLTVTTERLGNFAHVTFIDDGPGISKENMKLLFNPFFTTKEVGKGTGLGLSICHGIITEHGGKIWAESEPGKGATFIIELPIPKTEKSKERHG